MVRRRPRSPSLLALLSLLVLFAWASGCAKHSYAGESMSPGYYEDEAYGDAGYYDDADYEGEVEMLREESVSLSSRGRSGGARMKAKRSSRSAPPAAPMEAPEPEESAADMGEGDDMSGGEAPSDLAEPATQPTPSKKRHVIYTATLQVSVYDLPSALAFAESLPARHGGWLQERRDNRFVLRVPAEQLEQVMDLVAELGVVELRTLEGLDVTNQYTDLDSRIRVLEQMQAHLQELLEQAKTVEQALEVRKVLDAVTLELESARAQMRSLAQSIAFSTLILTFTERGPLQDLPESNDPFSWVDQLGAEATEWR